MKILFLDVDGVLNTDATTARFGPWYGVDDDRVSLLKEWLASRPNVSVVLSSTWRQDGYLIDCLAETGISWIDTTPVLPNDIRGIEVNRWLVAHPDVSEYVIFDDSTDFLAEQNDHFVWVLGLSESHLWEADRILKEGKHAVHEDHIRKEQR